MSEYNSLYLRVTVGKQGDPNYYFVQTEHVTDHPLGVAAPLVLYAVASNTPVQFAWWRGKTVGGPNFAGQNGRYNFRIVAVDKGANVSAEQSILIDLTW